MRTLFFVLGILFLIMFGAMCDKNYNNQINVQQPQITKPIQLVTNEKHAKKLFEGALSLQQIDNICKLSLSG